MTSKKTAAFIGSLLITCAFVFWGKVSNYIDTFFPLTNVQVEAPFLYVNKQIIEQQLTPFMKKGLLHINKEAIQKKLTALPWVKLVSVKRVFPDTLFINIHERSPVAIFNENILIDDNGKGFPIDHNVQSILPKLKGNAGSEKELLQEFKKVSKLLKATSLTIDMLETKASMLILTMTNDIKVIMNKKDAHEKIARFAQVYPELMQKKAKPLDQVDLRYKHGLAVKWKPLSAIER